MVKNHLLSSKQFPSADFSGTGVFMAGSAVAAQSTATSKQNQAIAQLATLSASSQVLTANALENASSTELTSSTASLEPATESADTLNGMDQVTSITQLTDVKPTDWAFQALQSLVERYGCIVGYPDKTFRGNRALSRYEFAAGVNACLDRINELLAAATADLVKKKI